MLRLSLLELFLRLIPEGIIISFALYILSNVKIDKKKLLISGVIFGISIYLIRLLPIHFGVHTILLIIIYIVISVNFNKINLLKAISSSLVTLMILSACDFINFFMIVHVFNISIEYLLKDPLTKTLLGLPGLGLFFIIILVFYKIKYKNSEESNHVFN
ncbi:MAG: hypothetical protein PWQ37_1107 [Candidatus Petromonas sp.]|jgi:hypothetical protein|nr:hypothetical protein [Candidatus Petromonas sp.]